MPETQITPDAVLKRQEPLVLFAVFEPVAGLDRFQPAGFPEVGHVIYKAPRKNGGVENVCIVDSAASMANHLEVLCMRGKCLRGVHDLELVDELQGMPYLRCVTGHLEDGKLPVEKRQVVVTSLTEGHRIASTYFLEGKTLDGNGEPAAVGSARSKTAKSKANEAGKFKDQLAKEFGIILPGSSKAHPPADQWWNVFKAIFRYDPNALVHGVMFPQWQIKIPRFLTAHLEALGASRVDRSGIKFDRLGETTSGQPIFAIDDATAREIRATFILDTALVQSFGRSNGKTIFGLNDDQKRFLIALALWKIKRLCESPFRFRSGCHLKCTRLALDTGEEVSIDVDIQDAIHNAEFEDPRVTDVFWPWEELYRDGDDKEKRAKADTDGNTNGAEEEESE
ncbi:MAG: type I-U CRISPR-associated protein Cas7 [Rhodospirillales bacterium]